MAEAKTVLKSKPRASKTRKRTRIQAEKEDQILEAALDVFSKHGFRGATIDQIAENAGLSKPNLLYYFRTKETIHRKLLDELLENWLAPLHEINPEGEPLAEIKAYICRKLELARDYPRESRLFANEILQGAPRIADELQDLKKLVNEKSKVFEGWIADGKLAKCDPHHLFFSIWATTQHYADFDTQVCTILGDADKCDNRFEEAAKFLDQLFVQGLRP
ncbi:MAG: TetR family transcriptional regulator C-terminal domain-containing protein [Rhizobiaceae bacterium]